MVQSSLIYRRGFKTVPEISPEHYDNRVIKNSKLALAWLGICFPISQSCHWDAAGLRNRCLELLVPGIRMTSQVYKGMRLMMGLRHIGHWVKASAHILQTAWPHMKTMSFFRSMQTPHISESSNSCTLRFSSLVSTYVTMLPSANKKMLLLIQYQNIIFGSQITFWAYTRQMTYVFILLATSISNWLLLINQIW